MNKLLRLVQNLNYTLYVLWIHAEDQSVQDTIYRHCFLALAWIEQVLLTIMYR